MGRGDVQDHRIGLRLLGSIESPDLPALLDKFHKSAEIKKNLAQTKIGQMKEIAIKEIKDTSITIAVDSVKKIITTSIDKSKLDNLFEKNLKETKSELKKINS